MFLTTKMQEKEIVFYSILEISHNEVIFDYLGVCILGPVHEYLVILYLRRIFHWIAFILDGHFEILNIFVHQNSKK